MTLLPLPLPAQERTHAVSRITLRRILLSGLDGNVHFGKEFSRYDQSPDGTVTAHFTDGTTAPASVASSWPVPRSSRPLASASAANSSSPT